MFIYLTKFYIDTKVEESSSVASLSSICDIGHRTQESAPRRDLTPCGMLLCIGQHLIYQCGRPHTVVLVPCCGNSW